MSLQPPPPSALSLPNVCVNRCFATQNSPKRQTSVLPKCKARPPCLSFWCSSLSLHARLSSASINAFLPSDARMHKTSTYWHVGKMSDVTSISEGTPSRPLLLLLSLRPVCLRLIFAVMLSFLSLQAHAVFFNSSSPLPLFFLPLTVHAHALLPSPHCACT